MSIHSSLKLGRANTKHRNVLTRVERLAKLEEDGRWAKCAGIIGIPKVRSIKVVMKKKKKAGEEAAGKK